VFGKEDILLSVIKTGKGRWNTGNKSLVISARRFGSMGRWLYLKNTLLLWSGFATVYYRTWEKTKNHNMFRLL